MIPLALLIGFALGCATSYWRGWNAHVNATEVEGHAKVAAQAERDRRAWRWPFVAVGLFVVAMVVLGMIN